MRTEKEMYDLIIGIAHKDERIRAVYMNGSRTNPNAPNDLFQDYDIVYVVTDTASFLKDAKWVTKFGDILMIQEPDKNDLSVGKDSDFENSYGYLMLFQDGNRIDLHLQTKKAMLETYTKDSLTKPLLDKDEILPPIPGSTDRDYWVKKPSEPQFFNCCNDFWWCLQNVAKGIWRDELPYAKQMFEQTIRVRLDEMVSWRIGLDHDFQVSPGKMGKYFKRYLPKSFWDSYKGTYSDSDYNQFWESIFVTCDLFRRLAHEVANHLSFSYPIEDDQRITDYLKRVRDLPHEPDAIF